MNLPLASAPNVNRPARALSRFRLAFVRSPEVKLTAVIVARPVPNGVPNRSLSRPIAATWPTMIGEPLAVEDRRSPVMEKPKLCPDCAPSAAVASSRPATGVPT